MDEFAVWHAQRLQLSQGSEGYAEWHGRTVAEALAQPGAWTSDVIDTVFQLQPDYFEAWPFDALLDISLQFPQPFLSAQKPGPDFWRHLNRQPRTGFLTLHRWPNYSHSQLESSAKAGILFLPVKIDLNAGLTQLQADARKCFEELFKKCPNVKAVPKGAAAQAPWNELKELAAYRLKRLGFGVKEANDFLARHVRQHRTDNSFDILPTYEPSSGGWSKACNKAEKRIAQLYPEPSRRTG